MFLKKIYLPVILLFMMCLALPVAFVWAAADFGEVGSSDPRIEQEDKLFVPADQVEAVWSFLYDHYVSNPENLKELDPQLTSYANEEQFSDTYFDTSGLDLLSKNCSVRHRWRSNLTNLDDPKSGRELVQIKVSGVSENPLDRGEFKYEVRSQLKHKIPEDNHPLLRLLKYADRDDFKNRSKNLGIDPDALKPILTVNDFRRRVYFIKGEETLFSFSLDSVTSELYGEEISFFELEDELNEVAFTKADAAGRDYLQSLRVKTKNEILDKFPSVKEDLTPKYNKSFNALEKKIPHLRLWIKFNIYSLISGIVAGLVVILILLTAATAFFIKKYRVSKSPR